MTIIAAVPLSNAWIELEPLSSVHLGDLEAAVSEPDELFRWVSAWHPRTDGLAGALDRALAAAARGDAVPWVIRRRADGRVVGTTSYLDVDAANLRVEVGATWIGPPWWRTEVNTATKLLVIGHAFETLTLERVALKTDHLNVRSQRAIERLGALREGVLRHHMRRADGSWRDTVYYSILRDEWPDVRARLEAALAR
ncbi:GNAT family N-acetyltransferase [Jiangella sp. DSM 45060]|uniref:GNAT family N-acetyltransferase n=1 Tax=Jiangella sp. DSM 45060 TaxID=1798224 RepID=UPI00087CDC57|nr:GNAT family protein [Jiangella sp. DSM 45060]SDT65274.1 Protein N-acetyltransferase, RimJ/RimL family [Jiangella sp. DSM 45060]